MFVKSMEFLYSTYKGISEDKERKKFLRTFIITEARVNNDIINIILNTGSKKIIDESPTLFDQLDTTSYELLIASGKTSSEVFEESQQKKFESLKDTDKEIKKLDEYRNKSLAELYDISMRKIVLLKKLAQADSLANVKIVLTTRLRNIEYSTRCLIQKSYD